MLLASTTAPESNSEMVVFDVAALTSHFVPRGVSAMVERDAGDNRPVYYKLDSNEALGFTPVLRAFTESHFPSPALLSRGCSHRH